MTPCPLPWIRLCWIIILSCGIKISAVCSFISSQSTRVTDGWTDGRTYGQNYDPHYRSNIAALRGKNRMVLTCVISVTLHSWNKRPMITCNLSSDVCVVGLHCISKLVACREHVVKTKRPSAVVMRGIPISEIYRGIKCHDIIYRVLVEYGRLPSGGIDDRYTPHEGQFT